MPPRRYKADGHTPLGRGLQLGLHAGIGDGGGHARARQGWGGGIWLQHGWAKPLGGGAIIGAAFAGTVFTGAEQLVPASLDRSLIRYVSQIPPWHGLRSKRSISSEIGCGYVTFVGAPVIGSVAPVFGRSKSAWRSVFSILSLHAVGGTYTPANQTSLFSHWYMYIRKIHRFRLSLNSDLNLVSSNIWTTRASVSPGYPNTRKQCMKTLALRARETLARSRCSYITSKTRYKRWDTMNNSLSRNFLSQRFSRYFDHFVHTEPIIHYSIKDHITRGNFSCNVQCNRGETAVVIWKVVAGKYTRLPHRHREIVKYTNTSPHA
jgi:hypothetical protein